MPRIDDLPRWHTLFAEKFLDAEYGRIRFKSKKLSVGIFQLLEEAY